MSTLQAPIAGCMRWGKWGADFSFADYHAMIEACLEAGITGFYHADIYGDYTTEAAFGKVLKSYPSLRNNIQLITKCGIVLPASPYNNETIKTYNTSAKHIILSVEQSLLHFETDYIDVLLIHRPNPLMHPEEMAEAVYLLQQQGKILSFGVSNFLPHQLSLLSKYLKIAYNQIEASILHLQPFINGTLDTCMEYHIIPMAWSPLGGGIINDDNHPRYRSIIQVATTIANRLNTGINEILIAWLHKHPSGILPVVGTTKIERLIQAKNAASIQLTNEDWFRLWVAATGEEIP
ncbi:aldo/keto reductase family oxidoreductase [Hydrotalea sp.]|uniref:aldo/keto reductase n=1 Tax=Hydrotalea sp. TaxID=2881279 RepID=UPI00260527CB|nr:aldo/keto reductase [Hydrotalea sp.]